MLQYQKKKKKKMTIKTGQAIPVMKIFKINGESQMHYHCAVRHGTIIQAIWVYRLSNHLPSITLNIRARHRALEEAKNVITISAELNSGNQPPSCI